MKKTYSCRLCDGRLFAVHVGPVNEHDDQAGLELLSQIESISSRLKVIKADKAYGGIFKKSAVYFDWEIDTTQSPSSKDRGFVPENHRWQVERYFAWLNGYRRLSDILLDKLKKKNVINHNNRIFNNVFWKKILIL